MILLIKCVIHIKINIQLSINHIQRIWILSKENVFHEYEVVYNVELEYHL